jgi:hypothetical protein
VTWNLPPGRLSTTYCIIAPVAKFPYAVRLHRGQGAYYLGTALPFPHALEV